MSKKLSDKDLKDWKNFVKSKDKIIPKDISSPATSKNSSIFTIDLHGLSLDQANKFVEKTINECFEKQISKINIITGKGMRSKNLEDPYQSKDLSILKYSVPDYIKNNTDLMNKIIKIDFESVNSPAKGNFDIFLKTIK